MKIYALARRLPLALLVLWGAGIVAVAATTFLTVSPTNLQGWQTQVTTSATATPTPSVTFVNGPGKPPLGTGSAEFRVGANGNDAAQLRHPGYAGTILPNPSPTQTPAANELSSLSYSTYVQQDGSGGQAPYLILQIDTDGDAGIEDLLFFEPVYQSATFCPSNPQPALVTGQWQTWDAMNGCWYSVFGTGGSGPGTNTKTLRQLSAALPTGKIANSSPSGLGGVRLVTGFGAGTWDNFVGNADAFRIGVGGNDTLYNFDPNQTTPTASALLISEMRFRGINGLEDEFVEIFNATDSAHVVSPPDGSSGYAVVASDGVARCTIPFGTVIPSYGHYLCANSDGYSLSGYPASQATTATPDQTFTDNMPEGGIGGVALFSTANPANFALATRLDAAGEGGAPLLYREGAGVPFITNNSQHSHYRYRSSAPFDTNDNNEDFLNVEARLDVWVDGRLGAPGPENLSSPVRRALGTSPLDPNASQSAVPNRERRSSVVPNGDLGTLEIRRRFTNNTAAPITKLRFRVVDITTVGTPATCGTGASLCADVRALTSADEPGVATSMGPVATVGVDLEQPPNQPLGGGYNSSLGARSVTLAQPLAPGASINVHFTLGVMRSGTFRFFVLIEATP